MSTTGKWIHSSLTALVVAWSLAMPVAAKYIGAEPRSICCCGCGGVGPECAEGEGRRLG